MFVSKNKCEPLGAKASTATEVTREDNELRQFAFQLSRRVIAGVKINCEFTFDLLASRRPQTRATVQIAGIDNHRLCLINARPADDTI